MDPNKTRRTMLHLLQELTSQVERYGMIDPETLQKLTNAMDDMATWIVKGGYPPDGTVGHHRRTIARQEGTE